MKSRFIMNMPSSEMTTVMPAKTTARPDVSRLRTDRLARLQAVVQPLAVARDDEQRVVDADADADHRRDLRRELGHRQEGVTRPMRALPQPMPKSAVMIGRPIASTEPKAISRMMIAARDADELARELGLLGEDVAAQLDPQPFDVDLVPQSLDHVRVVLVLFEVAVGEVQLGVGDLPALSDLALVARLVRADDLHAVDVGCDLCRRRATRLPRGRPGRRHLASASNTTWP